MARWRVDSRARDFTVERPSGQEYNPQTAMPPRSLERTRLCLEEKFVRGSLCVVFLIALLGLPARAQDAAANPPVTLRSNSAIFSARAGAAATPGHRSSYYPPFCAAGSCLYYAGDFDSTNSYGGLFNSDYDAGSKEGETWVGVKPDRNVTVTGATFVQLFTGGFTGINPTSFEVQVGIKPGQAGTTVCNTSGNATLKLYMVYDEVPVYSYSIKKLSSPCVLKKGQVYYVNLLPASSNGYGYLGAVSSTNPPNHHGWKNDLNDCYFNSETFGMTYVTCNSQGYFPEFSIALTGRQ